MNYNSIQCIKDCGNTTGHAAGICFKCREKHCLRCGRKFHWQLAPKTLCKECALSKRTKDQRVEH